MLILQGVLTETQMPLLQGLRGSVPPNFPYMHVELGVEAGHVHVIDDETQFSANLGRSVLIGLLGLPPEDMHRSARTEGIAVQARWAADFAEQWRPFDWTAELG